jgi:hypothetical protein
MPLFCAMLCGIGAERLFGRFVMRLELGFRNFQAGLTCRSQPGAHSYADFREGLFRRAAECRAGLQVRNIGDPCAISLGPKYDNGVAVRGHSSSLNPNSSIISLNWRTWYGLASFPTA